MDGKDIPMFGIFPTGYEASWVMGAPDSRIPDPENPGSFLPARFTATDSGGITNDIMAQFYNSIVVPITHGCEDVTGKRHIQLTDSAGPHCCLGYLRMLRDRGVMFCPRTPNLSHRQQNEDLCHFGKLKILERKKRQVLQNTLLMDVRRRTHHNHKLINFQYTMQCLAEPWESAFDRLTCQRGWHEGGYDPFTRLPMVILAKEIAEKEVAQERGSKRRRLNEAAAAAVKDISIEEIMKRIEDAEPAWQQLPDPTSVNSRTKISKAMLAQMQVSPSSHEAVSILEAKDTAIQKEQEEKKLRAEDRKAQADQKRRMGHEVFQQICGHEPRKQFKELTSEQLSNLVAYKEIKLKMPDGSIVTRKDQKIFLLLHHHPQDFPGQHNAFVEPPIVPPPLTL